jgi:hypothetical protein
MGTVLSADPDFGLDAVKGDPFCFNCHISYEIYGKSPEIDTELFLAWQTSPTGTVKAKRPGNEPGLHR